MRSPRDIELDVRAALRCDPRITDPGSIAVSGDEIGTVVLRGAVPSLPQRRAAVRDARGVEDVFEVIDKLQVHPPIPDRGVDDRLRAQAIEQLGADPRFRFRHIHVGASDGWVTLSGYVRDPAFRLAAVEAVSDIEGVVGVTEHIELR